MRTREWVAEERRLWDAMQARPRIIDSKKWSRVMAAAQKRGKAGHDLEDFKKNLGLVTEQEAARDSWRAYDRWIKH